MPVVKRWLYRSRQFFVALLGGVSPRETAEVMEVLGPGLYRVFAMMPMQYKRHAITVYRRVREGGCHDAGVWRAALLHDSGKYDPGSGRYVTIWHRVAVVLLEASPVGSRLLRGLSRKRSTHGPLARMLYPFYLNATHAERGAQLVSRHGASPEVVRLIADHHKRDGTGKDPRDELKALQAADDRS